MTGSSGDIDIVSTGSVFVQAPLHVSGSSTLGSTQAASLQVTGSSTLGSTAVSSLQVKAAAQFDSDTLVEGSLMVSGDISLGDNSTSSLSVYAVTTFESTASPITSNAAIIANAAVTANAALTVAGPFQAQGAAVIGTAASNTLTVNAVASFTAGKTLLYSDTAVTSTSAVLAFQRRLASSAVATGTVLGQIQFTGWDGGVDGLGAQMRSVFTVSVCMPHQHASICEADFDMLLGQQARHVLLQHNSMSRLSFCPAATSLAQKTIVPCQHACTYLPHIDSLAPHLDDVLLILT